MAKILFEHANSFEYNKEDSIHNHVYNNCLIARICFEEKDKLENTTKAIQDLFAMLKPDSVVLFPFAHLSSHPLRKEKAGVLFNQLKNRLRSMPLVALPFGISKGYKIDIKSHRFNNIFRTV